jgi:hypothetical protein
VQRLNCCKAIVAQHVDTLVTERINLKFVALGVALVLALNAPVAAAPDDDNNPGADASADAASTRYDSAEVIEKILSRSRDSERAVVPRRRSTEAKPVRRPPSSECFECGPRRHYDDQKVVKKVRNIDHSRVINTVTVVPAERRVRESNRLVIRNNEIRHVGVIQHNHIIVEKEVRYVQRAPATTTVNFVTHNYRVVERPAMVSVVVPSRTYECGVGMGRYQNSCGPALRVRD